MYYIPYPYIVYYQKQPTNNTMTSQQTTPNIDPVFPPVNTKKFNSSAKKFQALMQQANLLVDKIIDSHQFAENIMQAAQHSNKVEVEKLISSTGISISFRTQFTPDGIRIIFNNSDEVTRCCELTMILHW